MPFHFKALTEKVDPLKLRDPRSFTDGVAAFINSLDSDIERLQHFADTYAKSPKVSRDDRNAMALLSKDIGALAGSVEAPVARLGKDMKNAIGRQHAAPEAPRDARSSQRKQSDASAWGRMKKAWFPRG